MKTKLTRTLCLLVAVTAALAADSQSPSSLEGIWKWTFTMPDGSQVTPKLKLTQENGQLTGTSSFRTGNETPITNLVINGAEVSFEVVRERDGRAIVTRYSGTWSNDTLKGRMVSNWGGDEQSYDWRARRVAGAEGTWKWSVGFGGSRFASTVKLKQDKEKLTGKVISGRGTETDIKEGKIKNDEVSFEVERDRDGEKTVSRYYGRIYGDKILGKMESNFSGEARTNDWEALRVD